MRVVRHASLSPIAWKNGGGSTTTIAVEPAGASLDDFDWRISLATIEKDGPFSSFPGVDRSLALVEGEGVELALGSRRVRLGSDERIIEFAGERAVDAKLRSGSTTDLNVMTRRARYGHTLEEIHVAGHTARSARGDAMLVFLARGSASISAKDEQHTLALYDTLVLEPSEAWTASGDAVLLVATLTVRNRSYVDAP